MNPSKVQARKMVLVSVFALLILSVYRDRSGKTSNPAGTFRTAWGVGVVGMMLSLLADFAPQIAGPFAALTVLGSLTNGGEQALAKALGIIGPAPAGQSSSGPLAPGLKGPAGTPTAAPPQTTPPGPQGPAGNPATG